MNFQKPARFARSWASYYRSTRTVYLSAAWDLSDRWQGFILLHEGLHALIHRRIPRQVRWRGELQCRRLQYEVLYSSSPSARNLLERLSAQSQEELDRAKSLRNWLPSASISGDHELDTIFGRATSRADARFRRNMIGWCIVQHVYRHSTNQSKLKRTVV